MQASDMGRLKALETENRRLKQMSAKITLDHRILKDTVKKSYDGQHATRLGRVRGHGPSASEQRACRLG